MALFQAKHLWVNELADGVAALVLDQHASAMNVLDPTLLDEIGRAIDAVAQAGRYRLLMIRSGKSDSFCSGPAIDLLIDWKADDFRVWAERGQAVCEKLAALPIPSVAVIAGNCLNAGLELALACDYRVVVESATTSLGFPELEWGMIPCWGATQRLPRLIGLDKSLRMLLGGVCHDARDAALIGLADHWAAEADDDPPSFLADPHKRDGSAFPRRTWREKWVEANRLGRWLLFRGAERIVRTRVPDELPAPAILLDSVRLAYQHASMAPGLAFERQAITRVAEHPALHHLLRLLKHRAKLRSSPQQLASSSRVRRVGIIGSGVPALSLLLQCIHHGCTVVLRTADDASLGNALRQIVQILQAEVQRGAMTSAQLQKRLGAIRGTYTWGHFDNLDLVVDTTEGTLADKRTLFHDLENQVSHETLLVTSPHRFGVEDLRPALRRADRLLGLRIIEPWTSATLAELVAPSGTPPTAVERVRAWAVSLEKYCLEVPDRAGGLAMRVWLPALNEAALLLREGVSLQRIDDAMRRFGMSLGPLEWMDRLGLDGIASLVTACQPLFAGRIQLESGFALMVEQGWRGTSSGAGFYRRRFGRLLPHREAVLLWQTRSQGEPVPSAPVLANAEAYAWIQNRLVMLTILEAARCLEEGVATDADDLDCALCLTGWATHRGGPIGHARQLGADAVAATCAKLARQHGERFAPLASLKDLLARPPRKIT